MENSKEQGKKKIKEEDLSTVSGGCGKKEPDPHKDERYKTKMKCSECGEVGYWRGDYDDGIAYPCPRCGKLSFRGVLRHRI